MDDEFRGPISGNLHVPTSAAGLWGGSWTGATAGATHRGAGPAELCGGTAWGCRDAEMSETWAKTGNGVHCIQILIILYISYHIISIISYIII